MIFTFTSATRGARATTRLETRATPRRRRFAATRNTNCQQGRISFMVGIGICSTAAGRTPTNASTGQTTSDGINWSDTSAIWANTNQTQGYDPMSKTKPPTTVTWANVAGDNATYLYGDSHGLTDLAHRYSTTERPDVRRLQRPRRSAISAGHIRPVRHLELPLRAIPVCVRDLRQQWFNAPQQLLNQRQQSRLG